MHTHRLIALGAFTLGVLACSGGAGDSDTSAVDDDVDEDADEDADEAADEEGGGDDSGGGDGGDGGGPGGGEGNTTITSAGYNCDAGKGLSWYEVTTAGLAGAGELWITQDVEEPWDEYHPLPVWASNPGETVLYLELDVVGSVNDVEEGETTLFQCTGQREATLGFLVYVYDPVGAYADCVRWGSASAVFSEDCDNAL